MMKPISHIQHIANNPGRLERVVHAIVWIVLFTIPFLFRNMDLEINLRDYLRYFIQLSGSLVVFYANYSFLVKRLLFTRRIWLYVLSNLLLYIVVIVISGLFMSRTFSPEIENLRLEHGERFYGYMIVADFLKFIFLTLLCLALKVTGSWYRMDTERKELEKQRSEAELQNLKNQLNPHFLFNTLNNIYSLIAINGEQAQEAVHELSRLLRYMLYESAQAFVPLGKDIDFVRNYVELMRIRMPQHVDLETEIQIEQPEVLIAPLLFISPVENAFKHGVSNSKPSFVHIEIIAVGKQIRCLIRNSFFPKDKQDKSGSGIGLVNLKKRLDLLYPGNHELTYGQIDEIFSCELTLNLPVKS